MFYVSLVRAFYGGYYWIRFSGKYYECGQKEALKHTYSSVATDGRYENCVFLVARRATYAVYNGFWLLVLELGRNCMHTFKLKYTWPLMYIAVSTQQKTFS